MTKAVLCLDLGTMTGWCLTSVSNGSMVASGTQDFRPGRFDGAGLRVLRFRKWLLEVLETSNCSAVYFEEVRAHMGADAARIYGALFGVVTSVCEELSIPYEGVPVGTIKRFWTGKGNASKEMMIAEAHAHGYVNVTDDNEADAIALAYYAHSIDRHNDSPALVPAAPMNSRVLS